MTFNIDEYWSVTVTHGEKLGPKNWRATAQIYRRDTGKKFGCVHEGLGSTMNTADQAALLEAKLFISKLGITKK